MLKPVFTTLLLILTLSASPNSTADSLVSLLENIPDDTIKANLLNKISAEYQDIDYEKSLEYSDKAVKICTDLKFEKGKGNALYNRGIARQRMGQVDEGLGDLYKSLEIKEKLNDIVGMASVYNIIGGHHVNLGQLDEGLVKYSKSLEYSEQINDLHGVGIVYNNLGIIKAMKGETDESIEFFEKSLQIREEANDKKSAAQSLTNLGLVYANIGEIPKAIEYYERSLAYIRIVGVDTEVASIFNNLGQLYGMINDRENAIKYYEEYLSVGEQMKDKRIMALACTNLGGEYMSLKEFEKGKLYSEKSLELNREMGHNEGIAQSLYTIGQAMESLGQEEQSVKFYQDAWEMSTAIENKQLMSRSGNELGEAFLKQKNFRQAEEYSIRAYQQATELGYLEEIGVSANLLRQIYEKINEFEKALQFERLYHIMEDSLRSEDNVNILAELETKYETARKDLEIQTLKRERLEQEMGIQRQRTVRNGLLAGIGAMFLFMGLGVYAFRLKQRDNRLLAAQKAELFRQKTKITDSIHYASRIQNAMLPPPALLDNVLKNYFILFKPRDIVSGDFYWVKEVSGRIFIVAADCTGHGVPGAFMSMLGIAFLNEIVARHPGYKAGRILDEMRKKVKDALHQNDKGSQSKDGMDMAICIIDANNQKLQYAGAYNPIWLYRHGELIETKATRNPIAWYVKEKEFETHEFELMKGDIFYIFSDGFADQMGPNKKGKFKSKNFKKLLKEIHLEEMDFQKSKLDEIFLEWKDGVDQMDDICIVGVKV